MEIDSLLSYVTQEQIEARASARRELWKRIPSAETWTKAEAKEAIDLCAKAEVDSKWLSLLCRLAPLVSKADSQRAEYEAAIAAKRKADAAALQADADHKAAYIAADKALAAVQAERHRAASAAGFLGSAQGLANQIREMFNPIFGDGSGDFSNEVSVDAIPGDLVPIVVNSGLVTENYRLPSLRDPSTIEAEAEQHRAEMEAARKEQAAAFHKGKQKAEMKPVTRPKPSEEQVRERKWFGMTADVEG